MKKERTLAIIKPLAFKSGHAGPMITQIERAGFTIQTLVTAQLTFEEAKVFYAIHAEKPFFEDLCSYLSSGPILVMILKKDDAVKEFRHLIGATNPTEAAPNTLRRQFGRSIDHNAIHGSDAVETAEQEINFFFGKKENTSQCNGECCCNEGRC